MVWRTAILALFAAVSGLALAGSPSGQASAAPEGFAFGVIVDTTDERSMKMAREAGFTHAKMILHWPAVEPSPGNYLWNSTRENDFDNIMKPARKEGVVLVVRVDDVPDWAGGSPPHANLEAVARFYENLASYGAGTVVAYEILNEPNLPGYPGGWGAAPNPAGYTAFLKAAHRGIKAGDPGALVIGGGPSPNTGGLGGTMEDTDFIHGMYDAGAKGFMDALGAHNYGGNTEPERDPHRCGPPAICFRRAELYREVMVQRGDADTPIWATEWGYLMDPGHGLGQFDWMKISAEQQADYIVRAYRYADENWDWMQGMLLSNLDASTSPYHTGPQDGLPWFAILNSDYSPRPAWHAIQSMRASASPPRKAGRKQARAPAQPPTAQPAPAAPEAQPEPSQPAQSEGEVSQPADERLRVAGTDGDGVNLRAAPSASAALVKTIPEGAVLQALGAPRQNEGRSWRNVREPEGASGWVAAEYVVPM